MKIIFVNRYFYPDISATSQLLSDLAFDLARGEVRVEVVTSRQEYGDAASRLAPFELIDGVGVSRVWTSRYGRQHLFGRTVDYLTFYAAAGWCLLRRAGPGDIVVAKTDPPLISVVAAVVARLRGATLINWTQDLFPEVATALGVKSLKPVEPILRALRNFSLRSARQNVVLGQLMAQRIEAQGVPQDRIRIIHNWSDETQIVPINRNANPLRRDWGLADRFVVGYSGNMGRAHEFGTIIDAAELVKDQKNIRFLFIGGGAQADYIVQEAKRRGLGNVDFKPHQPREQLRYSLGTADLHLISLQPALEGLIVPSKFYGIAATGRPTLYIGDPKGEIPTMIKRAECGHTVRPGEAVELARYIENLAEDRPRAVRLGENARRVFEQEFSKTQALVKWKAVIDSIACVKSRATLAPGKND